MSINYSPELVRALMEERILEAREARSKSFRQDGRVSSTDIVGRLTRLLPGRSASQTVATCETC